MWLQGPSATHAMVVVSEEKKFVFVKTRKTGGSSVELALSGLAGRDAVVTLIMEDVDRDCRRAHQPRNYFPTCSRPSRFWNHMTFGQIDQNCVSQDLSAFTKIYTVRNPWAAWVSRFWWEHTKVPAFSVNHFHEEAVWAVWTLMPRHSFASHPCEPGEGPSRDKAKPTWLGSAWASLLVLCGQVLALLALPWVSIGCMRRWRAACVRRDKFMRQAGTWSKQEAQQHFKEFVMKRKKGEMLEVHSLVSKWQGGVPPPDQRVLRMEHLQEDFDAACKALSMPATPLPRLKASSVVPAHLKMPYQHMYDEETRLYVGSVERLIIDACKYSF